MWATNAGREYAVRQADLLYLASGGGGKPAAFAPNGLSGAEKRDGNAGRGDASVQDVLRLCKASHMALPAV